MTRQQLFDDSLITMDGATPDTDRADPPAESVHRAEHLDVYYGDDQALTDVFIEISRSE